MNSMLGHLQSCLNYILNPFFPPSLLKKKIYWMQFGLNKCTFSQHSSASVASNYMLSLIFIAIYFSLACLTLVVAMGNVVKISWQLFFIQ